MPYDTIAVHNLMLTDEIRTLSYKSAIEAVVRPGNRVLDFGCGSGILSFFAARAGASEVYAVDQSRFIRMAREMAIHNELDNVNFFHGHHNQVELPEKVDVIVSEWMGHFVFYEWMLEPLIILRDKYLKKGGRMIPQRISFQAALVTDEEAWNEISYLARNPYGIDFSPMANWSLHEARVKRMSVDQIASQTLEIGSLEMETCNGTGHRFGGSFEALKSEMVFGILGWFTAHLDESASFGTGPYDPETHWHQLMFPLPAPLMIESGQQVEIELEPFEGDADRDTKWRWALATGAKRVEMNNFDHQEWIDRELKIGRLD